MMVFKKIGFFTIIGNEVFSLSIIVIKSNNNKNDVFLARYGLKKE